MPVGDGRLSEAHERYEPLPKEHSGTFQASIETERENRDGAVWQHVDWHLATLHWLYERIDKIRRNNWPSQCVFFDPPIRAKTQEKTDGTPG